MKHPLLVLVGPTGIGKSALALELAAKFKGEIVNADSRQVFREMDIGTSKPTAEEFAQCPHHAFNLVAVNEPFDVRQYQEAADAAILKIQSRGQLPILVGGTGLYVKAVLYGLFEGPGANSEIRKKWKEVAEQKGTPALHQTLSEIDPEAATKILPGDFQRLTRALEVFELTGKPISQWQANHGFSKPRYPFLKIGLTADRTWLKDRIHQRILKMVEAGLENEAKNLFEKYGEHPKLVSAIGYREWLSYWKKESSKEEAIEMIFQNTRQLAKRQMTWFRKETDLSWLDFESQHLAQEQVAEFLQRFAESGSK